MKHKIEWYKENLKNHKQSIDREHEAIERAQERLLKSQNDYNFLVYQVQSAKKEGKDSFDSERYKVKRK